MNDSSPRVLIVPAVCTASDYWQPKPKVRYSYNLFGPQARLPLSAVEVDT